MKLKVTKKEIRESGLNILKIGYCQAQNLLEALEPFGYSCGVYGWSCDYYKIENTIICTGYSPIGKEIDYKIIKKYDKMAEDLRKKYYIDFDWKKHKKRLEKLIVKFIIVANNYLLKGE